TTPSKTEKATKTTAGKPAADPPAAAPEASAPAEAPAAAPAPIAVPAGPLAARPPAVCAQYPTAPRGDPSPPPDVDRKQFCAGVYRRVNNLATDADPAKACKALLKNLSTPGRTR